MRRAIWFSVPIAILLAAMAVAGAEMWSRSYLRGTWGFVTADQDLGWAFKPGHTSHAINWPGGLRFTKQEIQINSLGLRDREIAYDRTEPSWRILCIGDSFVEGFQVGLDELFTKRLERTLNEEAASHGNSSTTTEVINAGNGNYGTDQEYLFYLKHGRRYGAQVVVLFFYPINDFSDNSRELNGQAYMPKPFFELQGEQLVQLEGLEMPPRAITLRQRNSWQSYATRYSSYSLGQAYLRKYFRGFTPLLEGIGAIPRAVSLNESGTPNLLDVHRKEPTETWGEAFEITRALVEAFKAAVEEDGSQFVAVIIPGTEVLATAYPRLQRKMWPVLASEEMRVGQPEDHARRLFRELGIPTLDLAPHFLRAIEDSGRSPYLLPDAPDGHFSSYGHQLVSELLREFLLQQSALGPSTNRSERRLLQAPPAAASEL